MRIKATDSKGNILAVIDTATAKRIDAPLVTCTECQQVEPSRVLLVTRDGHAQVHTFTGRSIACSFDGRRVLNAVRS